MGSFGSPITVCGHWSGAGRVSSRAPDHNSIGGENSPQIDDQGYCVLNIIQCIREVVCVKVIFSPKRESQAAYEHPLQRQLDNPATISFISFVKVTLSTLSSYICLINLK